MSRFQRAVSGRRTTPRRWLVTGVAGFIGSNLLQALLEADQPVVGPPRGGPRGGRPSVRLRVQQLRLRRQPGLPKVKGELGPPPSPYAVTKLADELYAAVYGHLHGMETVGFSYFNVFGPRRDPEGAYAAVISRWIAAMLRGDEVRINGSGEISRDFCHVANVVQANLLAATVERPEALNQACNVAVGRRTTLAERFSLLWDGLAARHPRLAGVAPVYGPPRPGDVLHSLADISKARRLLGYEPTHSIECGLAESLDWYERAPG